MPTFTLPTPSEIEALHRKYAPSDGVFELVFTHCEIVRDIALQLAETSGVPINRELISVGCMLHDIGVYPLFNKDGNEIDKTQYITHGIRGEEILRNEGLSEELYRFASHHTGAGLTKKQIVENNLPLPHRDYLAETPEEELVMYADKFHSKTRPPVFNSHEFYTEYITRFGEGAVRSFAYLTNKFGKPNLEPLIAAYGYDLRD